MTGEWPQPRNVELDIAVPAGVLSVEPSLQLKTVKVGLIGRAAAVYRVSRIMLYVDRAEAWRELDTFKRLLEYLVTPPYLRRRVYPPSLPELRYAGILPPLQIPTHGVGGPKEGEVREAYVLRRRGGVAVVDAGLGREVEVELPRGARVARGQRIYVRISSLEPLKLEYVEEPDVYTRYSVETFDSFSEVIRTARGALIIATSRRGRDVREVLSDIEGKARERGRVVVLFGSPTEGLYEIAEREGIKLEDNVDYIVNTVPGQGTLTVRTEEAIWSTLAILNLHIP